MAEAGTEEGGGLAVDCSGAGRDHLITVNLAHAQQPSTAQLW